MSEQPWTKIFLSYARADASALEPRLHLLEARGITVLRDTSGILPTEVWRARLVTLIGEADAVVCVLSPRFADSEVCAWEVQTARELNKRLVPALLVPTSATALPDAVTALHWLPWQPELPDEEAVAALVIALHLDVAWVREHTRLWTLASHWDAHDRPDAGLLRGASLAAAESWLASRPPSAPVPTLLHQQFISASRTGDLVRRRRSFWIACSVAVLSAALGTWALHSSFEANRNLRVSESRRLASLSGEALLSGYPQRAALLAAHALQVPEARDGKVIDAYQAARRVLNTASGAVWLRLPGIGTAMSEIRAGRLAVATLSVRDQRWQAMLTVAESAADGRSGRALCTSELGDSAVIQVSLSDDGLLATAVGSQRVVQIRLEGERCMLATDVPHDFGTHPTAVVDPKGRWVTLADRGFRGAELIEMRAGGNRYPLGGLAGGMGVIALSADGDVIAAASSFDGRGGAAHTDALAIAWHLVPDEAPVEQVLLDMVPSAVPAPASALAVSTSKHEVRVLIGRKDGSMTLARFARSVDRAGSGGIEAQPVALAPLGQSGDPGLTALAAMEGEAGFWVGRQNGQVSSLQAVAVAGELVEGPRTRVSARPIRRLLPWSDGQSVSVAARDGAGWAPDLQWCTAPEATGLLACRPLVAHEGGVIDLAELPNRNLLLSLSQDTALRVWQAGVDAVGLAGEQWHAPGATHIAEGADGVHWFILGGDPSHSSVLRLASAEGTGALPPPGRTLAVSANGVARIFTSGQQLFVQTTGAATAPAAVPLPLPEDQDLVAISSDGHSLAVLNQAEGRLTVWRQRDVAVRVAQLPRKPYSHLVWSPAADALAIAEMEGLLWFWKDPIDGNTSPMQASSGTGDHRGLSWHPSGRWIVSAGFEATLSIWDARCALREPGCAPRRLQMGSQLRGPSFSPDGRWLSCGVVDGGIPLWRVTQSGVQEPPLMLNGHEGDVVAVSFSADSRKLASASFSWTSGDNSVRVWDLEAEDPSRSVDEVIRGTDWFKDVRLDRRAEYVVALTQDGQVQRHPLSASELVRRAQGFAGRELSEDERAIYFPSAQ